MFGIRHLSLKALLFAGLLSILISLGAFTPASAATPSPAQPAAAFGKVSVTVWDGGLMSIMPVPISKAIVAFRDTNGAVVAKGLTDVSGKYTISLTPAVYKLTVYANGYKNFSTSISVKEGQTYRLEIPLLK